LDPAKAGLLGSSTAPASPRSSTEGAHVDEPAVSATGGDAYWGRDWELRGRRQSGQRGLGEYNRARYAAALDARPEPIDAEASRARFAVGARVFHQKFGYGTVTAAENEKLEIDFDHSGRKKVMDSFVQPA